MLFEDPEEQEEAAPPRHPSAEEFGDFPNVLKWPNQAGPAHTGVI